MERHEITTVLGWSSTISGSRPPNFFLEAGKAGGARFTKNFDNLKIFEKLRLKNAIKMNLGDHQNLNLMTLISFWNLSLKVL